MDLRLTLAYTTLPYTTLHYVALRYIHTQHIQYNTIHYITLQKHCITLRYIAFVCKWVGLVLKSNFGTGGVT